MLLWAKKKLTGAGTLSPSAEQVLFDQLEKILRLLIKEPHLTELETALVAPYMEQWVSLIAQAKYLTMDFENQSKYKVAYLNARAALLNAIKDQTQYATLLTKFENISQQQGFEDLGFLGSANKNCDIESNPLHLYYYSEIIGHIIAYEYEKSDGTLHENIVIKDLNSGKNIAYDRRHIRVGENDLIDLGLIGEVLIPQEPQENPIIYIAWAGTHSSATAKANLECSAGEESYRKCEEKILMQLVLHLEQYIKENNKKVTLVFTGHSLGSAYAKLAFHSLQRIFAWNLAQKADDNEFVLQVKEEAQAFESTLKIHSKQVKNVESFVPILKNIDPLMIKEMSINVWNNTGVLLPIEESSNLLCTLLTKEGILHSGNFGLVDGDIVQLTGQGTILSDVENNGAHITVLQVVSNDSPYLKVGIPVGSIATGAAVGAFAGLPGMMLGGAVGGVIGAAKLGYDSYWYHTLMHFTPEGLLRSECRLYDSRNVEDVPKIQALLKNKSALAVYSAMKGAPMMKSVLERSRHSTTQYANQFQKRKFSPWKKDTHEKDEYNPDKDKRFKPENS